MAATAPLAKYIASTLAVTRPGAGRRKPQIKLMPTAAVGQPYTPPVLPSATPAGPASTPGGVAGQPNLNIPEPATVVGDSGQPYIRVGDNPNGPEALSVTPPAGPVSPVPQIPGLPSSMATGGVARIGPRPNLGTPALQVANQQALGGGNLGAFREGLQGYLAGQPVAGEWVNSPEGQAAIAQYKLPVRMANGGTALVGRQPRIVSMAAGGSAVIGADPYQDELNNANSALSDEQAVQAGAMNTADKVQAARAQTVQNNSDQQYAALGVAAPTSVNVAQGAPSAGNSALTRPVIASQEQQAQDTATRERALAYAQSRANSAAVAAGQAQQGGQSVAAVRAAGSAAGDAARAQTAQQNATQQAKITATPATPQTYQERLQALIENGRLQKDAAYNLDPAQYAQDQQDAQIAREKAATAASNYPEDVQMAAEARDAKIAGKVVYTDPYTGQRSTLLQSDADLRDAQYKKQLSDTMAASAGSPGTELGNLTTAQLLSLLSRGTLGKTPIAPDGAASEDDSSTDSAQAGSNATAQQAYEKQQAQAQQEVDLVKQALAAKKGANGTYYSPEEIDILIKDAMRDQSGAAPLA